MKTFSWLLKTLKLLTRVGAVDLQEYISLFCVQLMSTPTHNGQITVYEILFDFTLHLDQYRLIQRKKPQLLVINMLTKGK